MIPAEVTAEVLDRTVLQELRTLPEGLAETVGRHLAAAQEALAAEDLERASAHLQAARRRAARVAVVRETAGVIAYLQGSYEQAISELRAARRMTGSVELVPMIADCERALGRPQACLDLIRSVDVTKVDVETRVEILLVSAGARADLGNLEAAIVTLQVPELTRLPAGTARARLQHGYAEFLLSAGRLAEGSEWMTRAAASDIEGATAAAERCDELAGIRFVDETDATTPAGRASD